MPEHDDQLGPPVSARIPPGISHSSCYTTSAPLFTDHAINRMGRRAVTVQDVRKCIGRGRVIRRLPDGAGLWYIDILGQYRDPEGLSVLHVWATQDPKVRPFVIYTVYWPGRFPSHKRRFDRKSRFKEELPRK